MPNPLPCTVLVLFALAFPPLVALLGLVAAFGAYTVYVHRTFNDVFPAFSLSPLEASRLALDDMVRIFIL